MTANADDFLSGFEGFEFERVTLTDAVAYIAAVNLRLGKTDSLNPWKAANELVRAIQSGKLDAYSEADAAVTRVPISGFTHPDPYPGHDDHLVKYGNERSLRWRDGRSPYGEGDAIVEGRQTIWRRIVVNKSEVVCLWPFVVGGGPLVAAGNPVDGESIGEDAPIRKKLSDAGKRSGEVRRQNRLWVPHAEVLIEAIIAESPALGRGAIATEVSALWKESLDLLPSPETIAQHIKQMELAGIIPTYKQRMKKHG